MLAQWQYESFADGDGLDLCDCFSVSDRIPVWDAVECPDDVAHEHAERYSVAFGVTFNERIRNADRDEYAFSLSILDAEFDNEPIDLGHVLPDSLGIADNYAQRNGDAESHCQRLGDWVQLAIAVA